MALQEAAVDSGACSAQFFCICAEVNPVPVVVVTQDIKESGFELRPPGIDAYAAVAGKVERDALLDLVCHGRMPYQLKVAVGMHVHEAGAKDLSRGINYFIGIRCRCV